MSLPVVSSVEANISSAAASSFAANVSSATVSSPEAKMSSCVIVSPVEAISSLVANISSSAPSGVKVTSALSFSSFCFLNASAAAKRPAPATATPAAFAAFLDSSVFGESEIPYSSVIIRSSAVLETREIVVLL